MIDAVSAALTGVRDAFKRFDQTAVQIAGGTGDPARTASAMIELKNAESSVKANIAVLKTADEMIGAILDRLA